MTSEPDLPCRVIETSGRPLVDAERPPRGPVPCAGSGKGCGGMRRRAQVKRSPPLVKTVSTGPIFARIGQASRSGRLCRPAPSRPASPACRRGYTTRGCCSRALVVCEESPLVNDVVAESRAVPDVVCDESDIVRVRHIVPPQDHPAEVVLPDIGCPWPQGALQRACESALARSGS